MQAKTSLPTASWPLPRGAILRRRRLLICAAGVSVIAVFAVSQWNWLVAIGAASLLLGLAPCIAMCALGLCMHRMCGPASGLATRNTLARGEPPESPSKTQES